MRSNSSEHSIALGVVLGFIVGLLPLMGVQMAIAIALATAFRASRIAAVLPVWITNPATFVPIYGFNYWLGNKITGLGPKLSEYLNALREAQKVNDATSDAGYFAKAYSTLVESGHALLQHGWQAFVALNVGCLLVGVICGAIAYPITYQMMKKLRQMRMNKRLRRAQRLLEQARRETE